MIAGPGPARLFRKRIGWPADRPSVPEIVTHNYLYGAVGRNTGEIARPCKTPTPRPILWSAGLGNSPTTSAPENLRDVGGPVHFEGPKVCWLSAGGRWIRTFGSAPNPLPFSETAVPFP